MSKLGDLEIADGLWLDIDNPNPGLDDLKAIAEWWLGQHMWSKGEKQRAAYVNTNPEFLERVDRRVALCERIVEVCSGG